ncbi:MAG: hypothetical protein GX493_07820 [Firmicutes bacterium]|nr:hypothetical protein [Bacillota bacterium]
MTTDSEPAIYTGISNGIKFPDRFGFRSGERGVHTSRSIMLADLRQLLASTPADATADDYRIAIVEENVLGKSTVSTRIWTWRRLHVLYGFDLRLAVFRCFRQLWENDSEGRPLLAILCACARDPLLRMTVPVILQAPIDSIVTPGDFIEAIRMKAPNRFSPINLKAIGNRICSSWTQSGHLVGNKIRRRARPVVTPEATAYALVLGRLTGAGGLSLFSTVWTALLDTPKETLYDLAAIAARRGWIDFRRAGSVVDVRFPKLITPEEEEALRESD